MDRGSACRSAERSGLKDRPREIVFMAPTAASTAASSIRSRAASPAEAMRDDVLLAYAMNGAPLLPQHGAPLRLVVPAGTAWRA
jgi:DMSO/TMAO reductase YedYZ molybdopterin-dependent catalytic subunit